MTETINAYPSMPLKRGDLAALNGRLRDIVRANVDHHIDLLAAASARGARIICFGELFPAPYFALEANPIWLQLAEDATRGETVTRIREAAAGHRVIVIAPIYELAPSGRRFNTAVIIDERGEVLGTYRKTHIPEGRNEQGAFTERFYYEPGDGVNENGPANISANPFFPVFATSAGRIGIAICYDRHFEGVVWSLAREGAEIVFSPAVTFGAKSERMWRLEFAVDAARHNVFIAGSNRRGAEPPWNQPYFGDSHFVGPNGALDDASDHPNLIIADLDLAELQRADPSGWDLRRDVRHGIYSRRD